MADAVRIYTMVVCLLTAIAGTPQLARWFGSGDAERRLHWLASIAMNLAFLLGTAEAYFTHAATGVRVYLVALAVTWLLACVLYYPTTLLIERRRRDGT